MCFYYTQSDILLCGIARFSRGNKNKLRTFQPQKWKKLRTASLKQNLLVLIKKECILQATRMFVKSIPSEKYLSLKMYWLSCSIFFFLNQLSHLLCMIAISADDTTLNSTCNKACDLSEQVEMRCNLISKIKCFGEYFYFSSATFWFWSIIIRYLK